MKWKEKVDEAAEKLYDLVKSEKYNIEVNIPKKRRKSGPGKIKTPNEHHTKKWMAKNR
ncbi:hypothetical protein LOS21_12620 [Enterococcus faecium]|nr:hypothetical protein [Enterococcus faecium]